MAGVSVPAAGSSEIRLSVPFSEDGRNAVAAMENVSGGSDGGGATGRVELSTKAASLVA